MALLALGGCRKKPDPVTPPPLIDNGGVSADGHVKVVFENRVGTMPLQLNTGTYLNVAGDTFSVKMYKYYISNIRLWRADSTFFTEPESYHLINELVAGSKSFIIHEVPGGEYTSVSFMIGVDSARNVSGAQTGALDVTNGMYWDWMGYVMAKMEGDYMQNGISKSFVFHIGGFSGLYNSLRTVTLPFPEKLVVVNKTPEMHIVSDLSEWFKSPSVIDLTSYNNIMEPGRVMQSLVNNYTDMFTVEHIEN